MPDLRRWMFLLVVAGMVIATTNSEARRPKAGSKVYLAESVTVGGQKRTYRMDVPRSVNPAIPTAIVFGFHGGGGTGSKFAVHTGFNQMAAAANFILVCPDGVNGLWGVDPETAAKDIAMFDAILAKVKTRFAIDPDRVFAMGMSNGASFTHLLAAGRADTIAAIAPHSGTLRQWAAAGINADFKYPVFLIHGTDDTSIPVARAREARDAYESEGHFVKYLEIPNLGHIWATANGITPQIWTFFSEHSRE